MEDYLIEFCSPTLASLKVGSLFNYAYTTRQELTEQLERLNDMLAEKGVFLRVLRVRKGRALIYLCRKSQLEALLRRPEIARFLAQYGYRELELEQVLWHLQCRVCCSEEFPHEIGVFLGYPLEDVIGFIRWGGRGSKCSGIWKVYGDASLAQKLFAQYAKCRSVYRRLWQEGRSVRQLTVAV
ncbi:MAG: DUF3793 family protein [Candidatus Onthomonas sp.]|nr:DUF3793 family protein [Candidatus Onthomonas sp.]